MTRGISPPPTKRRKLSPTPTQPLPPPSSPPGPPSPNTLRIFSWNINGITPFLQNSITKYFQPSEEASTPSASLRGFLLRHHWPAIFFLQEVKIANTDSKTQDAVRKAVNERLPSENGKRGPLYDVYFTLPTDLKNARGLGGTGKVHGVCSIVRSDLAETFNLSMKHRTVDWDKEGRVSIVELSSLSTPSSPSQTSTQVKLAVFNIYAVNGTDSPYRDTKTGAVIGTRHDRKLMFHKILMEECISMEKEGWGVVLAGDFNVAPTRLDGYPKLRTFPLQHVANRADFLYKFLGVGRKTTQKKDMMKEKDAKEKDAKEKDTKEKETEKQEDSERDHWGGIDVWRAANPDVRRFTYFSRNREWGTNCDRVDYVITGKKFWEDGKVHASGMLDNAVERGPSDHVPIWADITLSTQASSEPHKTA